MTNPNPSPELLPCPFCGGEAYMTEGHRDHWRVECRQCAAKRHLHYVGEDGQERAIAAWNTRAFSSQTLPAVGVDPGVTITPAGIDPHAAFYAHSLVARGPLPTTQVLTIEGFLRAVAGLTLPAPGEVDHAEAARVMFEACRDRFMRAEQCYPAIDALAQSGFFATVAAANDEAIRQAAREAVGNNTSLHPWHVIDETIAAMHALATSRSQHEGAGR